LKTGLLKGREEEVQAVSVRINTETGLIGGEEGKFMGKKLKIAIIGCGDIARKIHIPAYLKNGGKAEIVALYNRTREKADACAAEFGISRVFTDCPEMLEKVRPDAVSVCVCNSLHAEYAEAALKAGANVLCEKPPGISVSDAERMEKAARESGKILSYGFQYRHAPEVVLLKKYIDAGELGDIYAARALFLRRRGIPGWGVFTNKELQGGGPLIDLGVHALDTVLYLMGYPKPVSVLGACYQKIGNREGVGLLGKWDWKHFSVEDFARGMILFEGGQSVILETSFALNIQPGETLQLSLMGDKGGADLFPVTLLHKSGMPLRIYGEKHGVLTDVCPVHYVNPDIGSHELEIGDFIECCITGTQPRSTAREGVLLQKIICGLYESAEKRAPLYL
jgi:predicted dehydrogenase